MIRYVRVAVLRLSPHSFCFTLSMFCNAPAPFLSGKIYDDLQNASPDAEAYTILGSTLWVGAGICALSLVLALALAFMDKRASKKIQLESPTEEVVLSLVCVCVCITTLIGLSLSIILFFIPSSSLYHFFFLLSLSLYCFVFFSLTTFSFFFLLLSFSTSFVLFQSLFGSPFPVSSLSCQIPSPAQLSPSYYLPLVFSLSLCRLCTLHPQFPPLFWHIIFILSLCHFLFNYLPHCRTSPFPFPYLSLFPQIPFPPTTKVSSSLRFLSLPFR